MKHKRHTLRMKLLRAVLIPFGVALWCVGWVLYYFGEQCRYMYNPERYMYQKLHKNVNQKEGEKMQNEETETEKSIPMRINETNEHVILQEFFDACVAITNKYSGKLLMKEPTAMYMVFISDNRMTGMALGDITATDVLYSLSHFQE